MNRKARRNEHRLALECLERRLLLSGSAVEFSRLDHAVGDAPQEIVVGDFYDDGYLDMVVGLSGSSPALVALLGLSSGDFWGYGFASGDDYVPLHIATGEVDDDQWTDMVVSWPYEGRLGIYYGSSTSFTSDYTSLYIGGTPLDVTIGDFNDDGRTDIAAANYEDGVVNVLYGLIGGGFGRTDYDVGVGPTSVLAVDLNDDGLDDLVVSNSLGDTLTVLLQEEEGGFERDDYGVGDYPMDTVVADFDGDGHLDIAVANADDGDISILYGNASDEFDDRLDFDAPVGNGRLAVSDLNLDGLPDILATEDELAVLYGQDSGTFLYVEYNVGDDPNFIAIGDFNDDGLPDVVVSNYSDDDVSVLTNLGVPATIELTEPSVDVSVQRGVQVDITWTDDAQAGDASINLAYDPDLGNSPWNDDDHEWIVQGLSEDDDGTDGHYSWDTSGVEPGTYTIWAVIDDGVTTPVYARAVGEVTIEPNPTVTVDLQAASDSGYSDSDNITNDTTPVYDITINVPGTVSIDWNGDAVADLVQAFGTPGTYSFQPAVALADGAYPVNVTFTDAALNEATDSNPTVIDTEAPAQPAAPDLLASSDLGLYDDDYLTSDNTPTFSVASTDNLFLFYRNGSQVSGTLGSGTVWTLPTQADGAWTYSYQAVDYAGNASTISEGIVVTIDTEAPDAPDMPDLQTASDTGASATDNVTMTTSPTFDLSGFGGYYRLYRNGALISSLWAEDATFADGPLADGDYTYELRALDLAGNESDSSVELNVTVDTTAPTVVQATPLGTVFEGEQYVTVKFSDLNEMWTATLTDLSNYELLRAGGDGAFGDENDVDVTGLVESVTYDPTTNTVTLEIPSGLGADAYRLTVSGAATVRDAAGNALDGDGDGEGGDDFVHAFATNDYLLVGIIDGPGDASVYVYDFEAPLDVNLWDVSVKFGKGNSVKSIQIGSGDSGSMDGFGLFVAGASDVGTIVDARRGLLGDVAFIGSDASVKSIKLNSSLSGYDVGGETIGGMLFAADVDGDGDEDDGTALYVDGWLGTGLFAGGLGGDALFAGVDAKGLAVKKLQVKDGGVSGDILIEGDSGKLDIFGDVDGDIRVTGNAWGLQIKGGDLNGNVQFSGIANKIDVQSARNRETKVVAGGSVGSTSAINILGVDAKGVSAKSVQTKGDFLGDLSTAGTLTKVSISGDYAGSVDVGDDLFGFQVKGDMLAGGHLRADGTLKKVDVKGDMAGGAAEADLVQITATEIGALKVAGDVTNARVLAGADLGADWSVDDGDLWGQGLFGKLTVMGNVADSLFAAGAVAQGDTLDLQWMADNDAFVDGSVLGKVTVKGTLTSTAGANMPFGIGAWSITSVRIGKDPVHALVVSET